MRGENKHRKERSRAKQDAASRKAQKRSIKEYTRKFYHKNKFDFFMAMLTTLTNGGLQVMIAYLLKEILEFSMRGSVEELLGKVAESVIYMGVVAGVWMLDRRFKYRFMRKAVLGYRNKAFDAITGKSISSFGKENTGSYISALTNDVGTIEGSYLLANFELPSLVLQAVVALAMMLWYSWSLTMVVVLSAVVLIFLSLPFGQTMARQEKEVSAKSAGFVSLVKDLLSGQSVIKSFQAQGEAAALYYEKNLQLEQSKYRRRRTSELVNLVSFLGAFGVQLMVFLYGAYLSVQGKVAPSVVIAFVQLMNYIINPIQRFPGLWANRKAAVELIAKMAGYGKMEQKMSMGQKISMEKETSMEQKVSMEKETSIEQKISVEKETSMEKEISMEGSGKEPVALGDVRQEIRFDHVSFSYDGNGEALKDVTLRFQAGKSYAIVGGSGCGKSTLLSLIMGSYSDYKGNITMDGKEVKEVDPDSIFDVISVIQQNVFIFDDTIGKNICMFKEFDEALVEQAIRKAGLARLMEEKGADYACGEGGSHLSGGEKQRISIARSLLRKSSVMLVDEATSALDAETAAGVTNAILDIQGLTRLVVTHKLDEKTLKRFDEIVVMRNGKVAEQGGFEELMDKKQYFYSLYMVSRE